MQATALTSRRLARALPPLPSQLLMNASVAERKLVREIREILAASPDLLTPEWRARNARSDHPLTGHCYTAAEALYHALGGKEAGWTPVTLVCGHDEITGKTLVHWWLKGPAGKRIDPTGDQFADPVLYENGQGRGFMTRQPSRRAQALLDRLDARRSTRRAA